MVLSLNKLRNNCDMYYEEHTPQGCSDGTSSTAFSLKRSDNLRALISVEASPNSRSLSGVKTPHNILERRPQMETQTVDKISNKNKTVEKSLKISAVSTEVNGRLWS